MNGLTIESELLNQLARLERLFKAADPKDWQGVRRPGQRPVCQNTKPIPGEEPQVFRGNASIEFANLAYELMPQLLAAARQFDPLRQIAAVWSIEDVLEIRPDLDEDQAMIVLHEVERHHDCNLGIKWSDLEHHAEALFPVKHKL